MDWKKISAGPNTVKFLHSPILHYAFSSWIEKTMKKPYIAIGKTDFTPNNILNQNFVQNEIFCFSQSYELFS